MARIILAAPESASSAVGQVQTIAAEAGAIEIVGHSTTSHELRQLLASDAGQIDVVVLHDEVGPIPVLELARDLSKRYPDMGLLLLTEEDSPDMLRAAMFAGVRAVTVLPLDLEEFSNAVTSAADWGRSVRERFGELNSGPTSSGSMYAFAGGKGGVGTSLAAASLAAALVDDNPDRSTCLVDLDLQKGDIRAYFNVTHGRSITDLVTVAHQLTTRHLDEALYRHQSGLRLLLPPVEGELGEGVDTTAARQILGSLRSRFDVVVVDVGSTMNEATAAAVEMADEVVVVTTTNVPALRGANRLTALWERLKIRTGGVHALINRVSRDNEVQPDLCERVLRTPVLRTTLTASFRQLEPVVNTGRVMEDNVWKSQMLGLLDELAAAGDQDDVPVEELTPAERQAQLQAQVAAGEAGQAAAEFTAVLPMIGVAVLAMWQLLLGGWTLVQAQDAAREAARQLTLSAAVDADDSGVYDDVEEVVYDRLPADWAQRTTMQQSGSHVTVTVDVPSLLPFWDSVGSMSATSGA